MRHFLCEFDQHEFISDEDVKYESEKRMRRTWKWGEGSTHFFWNGNKVELLVKSTKKTVATMNLYFQLLNAWIDWQYSWRNRTIHTTICSWVEEFKKSTENSLRYHNFHKKDEENKQHLIPSNLKTNLWCNVWMHISRTFLSE